MVFELLEDFEVNVGIAPILQWLWILSLNLPETALSDVGNADELFLRSVTIEGLRDKFLGCKEAFESRSLNAKLGKPKKRSAAASQRMPYLKVKFTPLEFAA